jgi:hypothetical protein
MAATRYSPAGRKNLDTAHDPYLARKTPPSIGVCPVCHAINRNRRWVFDEAEYRALSRSPGEAVERRCPACRKIADGFPSGIVLLSGGYLQIHRDEILRLVRNEEGRAMGINPLERIMAVTEEDGTVRVTTTDEKLAQRIGREVRKAFRGSLEYRWSEDDKLVRVSWARHG